MLFRMCTNSGMAAFRSLTLKCLRMMSSRYFGNYRNEFRFASALSGVTFTFHARCLSVTGSVFYHMKKKRQLINMFLLCVMSGLFFGTVLCVVIGLFHITVTSLSWLFPNGFGVCCYHLFFPTVTPACLRILLKCRWCFVYRNNRTFNC
jgi:hypothetical protein